MRPCDDPDWIDPEELRLRVRHKRDRAEVVTGPRPRVRRIGFRITGPSNVIRDCQIVPARGV